MNLRYGKKSLIVTAFDYRLNAYCALMPIEVFFGLLLLDLYLL